MTVKHRTTKREGAEPLLSQRKPEIIIRKKGDKDAKITVEISGDKVTINGKPLAEFKDDEATINRRNIIIRYLKGRDTCIRSARMPLMVLTDSER